MSESDWPSTNATITYLILEAAVLRAAGLNRSPRSNGAESSLSGR